MQKAFTYNTAIRKFTGSIERVLFHNDTTLFSILVVATPVFAETVTVQAELSEPKVGETITCSGSWKEDRKHGLQFVAADIAYTTPHTLDGIEKYLASGLIDGIGPVLAERIVARFGVHVFHAMENEPHLLYEVPGLGDERVEALVEAWQAQKQIRELMTFLQSYGMTGGKAQRIYKHYGAKAIDLIRDNPYRLAEEMFGIGFKTVDAFALRLGVEKTSQLRVASGIRYALTVFAGRGDCAIEQGRLMAAAARLLNVRQGAVAECLAQLEQGEEVVAEQGKERRYYYLAAIHRAETGIVANLQRIIEDRSHHVIADPATVAQTAERRAGLILAKAQREAIRTALSSKVAIVTGGPGVGKTTITTLMLDCFEREGLHVTLCAPTGKAAKRMAETTGRESKTVHRTLDYDGKTHQFRINAVNPLATDVVILDEASMMDVVLMNTLLDAIPAHARLIIIGDRHQLASVGPGAVLGDMLTSGVIPTVHLTEVYRQAKGKESHISRNAHRVNSGLLPERHSGSELSDFYFIPASGVAAVKKTVDELVFNRIPNRFGFTPEQIQVLTPTNKGELGTKVLNQEFQARLNPAPAASVTRFGTTFAIGDKVMQVINDYDREVFNGETGTVVAIDTDAKLLLVDFDDFEVEYAFDELDALVLSYVMTVHKSQGSEYPVVVIPLASEHGIMLERNLLYTGMTRGKQLVIIVGEMAAVQQAVTTVKAHDRATLLAKRLAFAFRTTAQPQTAVRVASAA